MNSQIVAHEKLDVQKLQALRAKLLNDLQALEALPQHELERRYYQIQPQLRHVCRELSLGYNRCGSEADITKTKLTGQ